MVHNLFEGVDLLRDRPELQVAPAEVYLLVLATVWLQRRALGVLRCCTFVAGNG